MSFIPEFTELSTVLTFMHVFNGSKDIFRIENTRYGKYQFLVKIRDVFPLVTILNILAII